MRSRPGGAGISKSQTISTSSVTRLAEHTGGWWQNLATARWTEGRWDEARTAAAQALATEPALEPAALIFARCLTRNADYDQAAVVLHAVTERNPGCVDAWHDLGIVLAICREYRRAEFCYCRALELDPKNQTLRRNFADLLTLRCRTEEARAQLRPLVNRGDDLAALRQIQIFSPMPSSTEAILEERCAAEREITRLTHRMRAHPGYGDNVFTTNFPLAYHGRNDRQLNESWAKLMLTTWPALGTDYSRPRSSSGRLKVAFISAHMSLGHTIAKLNTGLMATLPRDRFEVVAVDVGGAAQVPYLQLYADKVVRVPADQHEGRRLLAAEDLDVAFFTDVGMHPCAWGLALSRYAPVQCTTWGHPVTTGLPSMDYFISSDLIEPPGAEEHYSEKLVRLSTLPTVYRRPRRDESRLPQFPDDWHVYFCAQSLFKCHPSFDEVWASILRTDPQGRLLFVSLGDDYDKLLLDRLNAAHPDIMDRVVMLGRMSEYDFLGLQKACHVMLDTWPFGGGNTNYEAFSFGAPVVTLPGDYMRGRVACGLYGKMGFRDLIADSPADYISKAVHVASDPDYRRWIQEQILQNNDVIYDDARATEELAAFFESACAAAGR